MIGSAKKCRLEILGRTSLAICGIIVTIDIAANYSRFLVCFEQKAKPPPPLKQMQAVNVTPTPLKSLPADVCGCFTSRNVSRLGILGDSQGARYKKGLQSLLGVPCTGVRMEGMKHNLPEARYYCLKSQRHCDEIVVHKRRCSTCISQVWRCDCSSYPVIIDYLAMESVMDAEVTLRSDKPFSPDIAERNVLTTQEFIFKHMWTHPDTRPDAILIFSAIVHDVVLRKDGESFRRDLAWLLDLLVYYTTQQWTERTVEVWYFNSPLVVESKIGGDWIKTRTNGRVTQFNAIFAEEYQKRVTSFPHIFKEAPNLQTLSSSLPVDFYMDAVHFIDRWYVDSMTTFLTAFCSS